MAGHTVFFALCLMLVAAPAAATKIHLDCTVQGRSNRYFQPAKISLDLDTDSKVARVADELVALTGKPTAKGKIETFNEKRLTVIWSLRDLPRDPKLSYALAAANVLHQRLSVRLGGGGTLVSTTAGQTPVSQREFRADLTCQVRG